MDTGPAVEEAMRRLRQLPPDQFRDFMLRTSPAYWSQQTRGFDNQPFHLEWYEMILSLSRVAVVAPREHAKTEVFTVNQTAWRSIYQPGTWTYIFAATQDLAFDLKARVDEVIRSQRPDLFYRAMQESRSQTVLSNRSRITAAGAGKKVRGAHPDVIIGDDVLDEEDTMSRAGRERMERWWKGTVGGMAHPGESRHLGGGRYVRMAPTRVFLVGTPFHQKDLLMSMRTNPLYHFRRYAAEYDPAQLVPGTWAVEAS